MPNKTMKTKIQVRRDTTANWLTNKDVVPAAGEPCFDLELGTLKIGDGVTSYENLKEISGGQAAHYEGVKGDGESYTDVISRVLTAAGAEAQKDDIFVVKALIAGGKYSYTPMSMMAACGLLWMATIAQRMCTSPMTLPIQQPSAF